jgi:hypothetical protein
MASSLISLVLIAAVVRSPTPPAGGSGVVIPPWLERIG